MENNEMTYISAIIIKSKPHTEYLATKSPDMTKCEIIQTEEPTAWFRKTRSPPKYVMYIKTQTWRTATNNVLLNLWNK